MRTLSALVLAAALAGCGPTVQSVERVSGSDRVETGSASCNRGMGVCYKCGMTLQMEYECSLGVWRNCPGSQPATYSVWTNKVIFSDGTEKLIQDRAVKSRDGKCT